jgi:hypothetical protein
MFSLFALWNFGLVSDAQADQVLAAAVATIT